MKINILSGCVLAASMLLTTSCSDFLTEDPKGQLTNETLFKTKADLDLAVNSLYSNIQGFQCNSNTMIVQCMGDDVTSTTGSNKAAYLAADVFEDPTDLKGVNDLWSWYYNIIKASNYVIDCANFMKADKSELGEQLGQAYFWRAYAYYGLVRTWGQVPISPEEVISVDLKNNTDAIPCATVEEIFNYIVKDLKAAEECNLPEKYSAPKAIGDANVFVTSQAVKSMLSAVYMSMAGYPLNKTEYYALAADKAKEVVDAVKARNVQTLLTDWNKVYSYGEDNHNECILGIYYNANTGSWGWDDSQLTCCHVPCSLPWGGWGDFLAERHFWSKYPAGPRKDAVYAKTYLTSNGNNVDWWATVDGEPYYKVKGEDGKDKTNAVFSDYRPMFTGFSVNADDKGAAQKIDFDCTKPIYAGMTLGKRHQLIRYAEVLCWFAEASARSGKYIAEAKEALKQVRARAYSDAAAVTAIDGMSNDQLAEAAYNEHRYEVAGNVLGMVTCREDEFRMNRLKEVFDYRVGPQSDVLVPAGTLTHSVDAKGNPFEYKLKQDLVLPENMQAKGAWRGDKSVYHIYPPTEAERNPNLKR
ncbi:RagB/SusD family nutrient uptake outer membrane protein [Prevotella sp.]|uniref:RagB/SusD family nutrient uptake outer membrane protein n=1 Tax=Prevotella sp. TaxID=59823 RepID=UPI0025E6ED47|nr:RagB/SusD family nutrient uptake outer membrane protein [Prevotella sp.]